MLGFLGFASATAAKKGFPAKMRPLMGCFGWGIKWFPLLYIFGDVDNGKMGSCQNMPPKVPPFKGSTNCRSLAGLAAGHAEHSFRY